MVVQLPFKGRIARGSPLRSAHRAHRRRAFTLIEVLMVVTAMAIIAGVVVPQVSSVIDDAKHAAMITQLNELSAGIERYQTDHNGRPPDLVNGTLPQLMSQTNMQGTIGAGPNYNFGPYIRNRIPANPLNDSSQVFRSNTAPPANLELRIGWVYHPETGQIWAGLHQGAVE